MNRFENGFDSYQKAIAGLEKRSENEFELKAAVMNFHHAIEVLFKHILCSKSKCLIYRDVDSWTNTAFSKKIGQNARQGEHADYTINFDETVKRVMVVYEEPIDSYVYNGFLNLSKLRNALTHDEVELKIEAVEQIVVTLTQIVTAILQKHLTGAEKEKFDVFVASEPYQQTLQNLIGYNLAWRVTTISNLLELYSNQDYESLSNAEIRHLESTLSILNVVAKREDIFCNIDDDYYLTYISYLKQEICDLLIGHLDFIKGNEEIKFVIRRTDVIKNIVQEYLVNAAQYVWELLDWVSFETEETVHELLDHNSFLNNHDIYIMLHRMKEIIDVVEMIAKEKRRKVLLEKIYLDEGKETTLELFYSTLINWFSKNYWFNRVNIAKLDEEIRDVIESDDVSEELEPKIQDDELYEDFIGEFGEWGTIDRIDDITLEELKTVVKSGQEILFVYNVSFSTQTYFDHEYFDNGSKNCFVKVAGHMNNRYFVMEDVECLGPVPGFRAFKFF